MPQAVSRSKFSLSDPDKLHRLLACSNVVLSLVCLNRQCHPRYKTDTNGGGGRGGLGPAGRTLQCCIPRQRPPSPPHSRRHEGVTEGAPRRPPPAGSQRDWCGTVSDRTATHLHWLNWTFAPIITVSIISISVDISVTDWQGWVTPRFYKINNWIWCMHQNLTNKKYCIPRTRKGRHRRSVTKTVWGRVSGAGVRGNEYPSHWTEDTHLAPLILPPTLHVPSIPATHVSTTECCLWL